MEIVVTVPLYLGIWEVIKATEKMDFTCRKYAHLFLLNRRSQVRFAPWSKPEMDYISFCKHWAYFIRCSSADQYRKPLHF